MPAGSATPDRSETSRLRRETGKRGPFDSVQQELYLNLLRTRSEVAGPVHACLKRHGLREAAYNALRIVAGHGEGGVPSQSIAGDMVARVPDVTRLVDGLERRGLVGRHRCSEDRRVVHVRLTPEGRATVDRVRAEIDGLHRRQFPGLSPEQATQLIHLLERARETDAAPPA